MKYFLYILLVCLVMTGCSDFVLLDENAWLKQNELHEDTEFTNPDTTEYSDVSDWFDYGGVGNGKNIGNTRDISLVVNQQNNKPIVAFFNRDDNYTPYVMEYISDTDWRLMGKLYHSSSDYIDMAINSSDNKPVVVFSTEIPDYMMIAKKWESLTSWDDLGLPYSSGVGPNPEIVIDPSDNKPFISTGGSIKKLGDTTDWNTVLSNGDYEKLTFTLDNQNHLPIIAFYEEVSESIIRLRAERQNPDKTWTDLGVVDSQGQYLVHAGTDHYLSMIIDPLDNKPILAYHDYKSNRIKVKKWQSGTTWIDFGYVSDDKASSPFIINDPVDNKPFVLFIDDTNNFKPRLKKFDSGSEWLDLGHLTRESCTEIDIAIDLSDNKPVISYMIRNDITEVDGKLTFKDNNLFVTKWLKLKE